ncbi:MAG TPA: glycosyltransferase, partial [Balneolales bacterium]|nr:glycosyltransferase [Balneolales bacterium]
LPQKGVHLLVRALQAFSKNQVDGYVFGGGPEPVIEWLKSLDKTGRVTFTGAYKPADLPALLGKIDVIVIPSIWEDCAPLVVAEALAARLPVIGAKMGGIPDFIDDGKTGFLFPYNDVKELIQRIGAFVSDPALLGKMQRQIVRNRTFGDYIKDLLQHYDEVLGSGNNVSESNALHDEKPSVVWEGSQFVTHSLAHVNRSIGKELLKKGFNLSLIPFEKDTFIPDKGTEDYELYRRYGASVLTNNKVHVRHHWPPNFTPPASGHWVMIQPWEFGSLPEKWIRPMSTQLDEVWVPSSYVKECYVRSGVPENVVQVVPNGVDVETFHPSAKPYPLKTKKSFKFLFVGGTIGRKGIDVLLDAYIRNFKASDDVCLVIKDMGGKSFYQGQTAAESIAQLQAHQDAPGIEYIDRELTNDEMAGLYTACDCLVHPYRGEGFGLPIAEAMSAGLPVVVTDHGAALDFCNQDNAWLVDAKEVKLTEKTIGNIPTVDYPWWAEPDSGSLSRCMREVWKNPEEAKRKVERARETILSSFTWDQVGNKVADRILEISKRPVRRLKTVSEIHRDGKEAFIQYFMQGVQKQKWNDLEKETLKACRSYSNDSYIWVLRAISLRMVSRFDDAIEAVECSLKIEESPEALHEAIQIAQAKGEKEQAVTLTEYLENRFPKWAKNVQSQYVQA